jgi:hypothetical protein
MSFSSMCNDKVTLVKNDGTVIENIKASVQPGKIFIFNDKLPIEEEDRIYRPLPNGLVENYVVVDRGFFAAQGGIQGHYQIVVRKETSIKKESYQKITNVYNINGNNQKVNVNSTDNSININFQDNELFDKIILALQNMNDDKIKSEAIRLAKEMKESIGKRTFIEKYQNFISVMANHVSIIAPFLPALTGLLS